MIPKVGKWRELSVAARRLTLHNALMAALSVHVPVAIILLVAGVLSCFLGYRLFRWLLALYGFVGGAYLVSLFINVPSPWATALIIVGGGLTGAAIVIMTYLAGLAILGAGLGVLALSLTWTPVYGEPETWLLILTCLVGAVMSVALRRYVIIVGTAFGGAWIGLIGTLALAGHGRALAVASGDIWQVYPLAPANGQLWFAIGWFALGSLASFLQLRSLSFARATGDD